MALERRDHTGWCQGDACLEIGELPVLVSTEGDAEFFKVDGVVVVTQTCDLVRDPKMRPRFQVAGLVKVTEQELEQIRQFGRPQYAYLAHLADRYLVADLDLVASFDKAILSSWDRVPVSNDALVKRDFAYALGRHRTRAAFPDRWAAELSNLRNWLRSKSSKDSPEGKFAKAIAQMRIVANDVDCPPEALIYCFIPETTSPATRNSWVTEMIPKLESKISNNWGCDVSFMLVTNKEISAADYLDSIRLDFDALSMAA